MGKVSLWKKNLSGISQGSALVGPLLILIYINNLSEGVSLCVKSLVVMHLYFQWILTGKPHGICQRMTLIK